LVEGHVQETLLKKNGGKRDLKKDAAPGLGGNHNKEKTNLRCMMRGTALPPKKAGTAKKEGKGVLRRERGKGSTETEKAAVGGGGGEKRRGGLGMPQKEGKPRLL